MKRIEVEIEGESPLLMHAMGIESQKQLSKKTRRVTEIPTPEEEAENGAYRTKTGELCIPTRCVKAMLVNAASWYKMGKISMRQLIAGGVLIEPHEIGLGTKKYEIDLRPAVVQKSRVMRARPCLPKWKAKFTIIYNDEWIKEHEVLKKILAEAGVRIGILDNRPQKGGENGTFRITQWNGVKE